MIKFFRKIRQKLLSENKFSKYLIYAIGEIILVVIGILIALQINNANENNKKKDFEVTILENIQEDILADKIDCELNRQYLEQTLINEQLLLDFLLKNKEQNLDSISFVDALGIDVITAFHNASFNNLQNNDIGLISNNELYKKITRFYDFYVFSLKKVENEHVYTSTYKEKLDYFKKHFKVIDKRTTIQVGSADDTWNQEFDRYNFAIKNKENLKDDEEFKLVLAESLFINSIVFDFYNQLFSKMDELNKSINKELDKLKK
ncbi:DUF6090 family protein [Winogradskyella sp. A2]|uniref:DUF6090 family protein n=1 Tax=Winogradskyella sp. A2 TaxID=3366944 RepID=UPI00398C74C7